MTAEATGALWHPSPNFGARRGAARPRLVVLHYTAMQSAGAARDWLSDPASEVSAHYVIAETGTLWQLVAERDRAWHAGVGSWGGIEDVNSSSIGIEIANDGTAPFAEPQMARLEILLGGILARWRIPPEGVIGHSDMAPARKQDPGPRFDWRRLARRGLSIWPATADPGAFDRDAARFGYGAAPGREDAVLASFRMRFRPGAAGPLCQRDRAIMADLAARWPAFGGAPA